VDFLSTDLTPVISPAPAPSDADQVKTLPPYPDTEVVIPEGHGWLEGDASFNSEDSNHFGPVSVVCPHVRNTGTEVTTFGFSRPVAQVPLALIDSKLSCVLWPLDRVGAIGSHTTGTQAERVQVVQLSRP
jgi:inner membrane protease subunit 2